MRVSRIGLTRRIEALEESLRPRLGPSEPRDRVLTEREVAEVMPILLAAGALAVPEPDESDDYRVGQTA